MSTTPNEHTCCPSEPAAQEPRRKRGLGVWATAGSLTSAILASACCWLPLVAIAFGASAAGAGAFFEQYRPYFLAVAAALLAAGFYFLYIRKENCEPGSACAVPSRKAQRFNKAMFWVSVLFIAAFAFFPNYVGLLLGGTSARAVSDGQAQVSLTIEGMTCEGCTAAITKSLSAVDGVQGVEVDYHSKSARVVLADDTLAKNPQPLLDAVKAAGYDATLVDAPMALKLARRTFAVEGMTCAACAAAIRAELTEVPGVAAADVLYEKKRATVQLRPAAATTDEELLAAIERAGYRATLLPPPAGGDR